MSVFDVYKGPASQLSTEQKIDQLLTTGTDNPQRRLFGIGNAITATTVNLATLGVFFVGVAPIPYDLSLVLGFTAAGLGALNVYARNTSEFKNYYEGTPEDHRAINYDFARSIILHGEKPERPVAHSFKDGLFNGLLKNGPAMTFFFAPTLALGACVVATVDIFKPSYFLEAFKDLRNESKGKDVAFKAESKKPTDENEKGSACLFDRLFFWSQRNRDLAIKWLSPIVERNMRLKSQASAQPATNTL